MCSFDDLLVGAPMYSDTRSDEGRVYVYMNSKGNTNMKDGVIYFFQTVLKCRVER